MIPDAFLRRQLRYAFTPGGQLYFPHGRRAFLRSALRWDAEARKPALPDDERLPRVTAVLLSYARPWNVDPMVRMLLRLPCVERVIVSNNNPGVDLSRWLRVRDDRLRVLVQPAKRPASMMAMLALDAADEGATHMLSVDDDLLLFPRQLMALLYALAYDPSVPHGLVGQRIDAGEFHVTGGGEVDVLNRVYAFTAAHVRRYAETLERLGYETRERKETLPFGSDIVLSHCGEGRPRIHDAGRLLSCPTAALAGIARFKEPGFDDFRAELLTRVRALSPRSA